MDEIETTRWVVAELGFDATPAAIAQRAQERHGVPLDVRFIPLYVATLRGQQERERMRQRAAQECPSAGT